MNKLKENTLFAVYGTLRQGQGNWAWALQDSAEYLGTKEIPGFKMYSLGGYPMITKASEENTIIVDLFRQPDARLAARVDGMELGAGYDRSEVVIDGETYIIYTNNEEYYPTKMLEANRKPVASGDWVSFKTPKLENASV